MNESVQTFRPLHWVDVARDPLTRRVVLEREYEHGLWAVTYWINDDLSTKTIYEVEDNAVKAYDSWCRFELKSRIDVCAEKGKIAVVESGRDCDGVKYSGSVHTIYATVEAYEDLFDETAKWADGPFSFTIMKPSEAEKIEYTSRDLVLEAHEDGHPHVIYG